MKHGLQVVVCGFCLCFFYSRAISQTIQYRPYLRSSCTDTFRVINNYSLKKGSLAFYSLNIGNTITLPDTGTYFLESPETAGPLFDSITVQVRNKGFNSDTLKAADIGSYLFIDSKPPKGMFNGVWLCCGKMCNGSKSEYYNNGAKYFEGRFKKGRPVGKFTYYYSSGKIKAIIYYSRKGKELKTERFKDS
jgi:hypothetical protein